MLNPIFLKKVQGQKHPGRWEIAERQIPSVKMLFKTNIKGHKHPSIRLFIIEQDTIGKTKKTKSGIQPRNRTLPVIVIESMVTRAHPSYTQAFLTPGICSLIKPDAVVKLM